MFGIRRKRVLVPFLCLCGIYLFLAPAHSPQQQQQAQPPSKKPLDRTQSLSDEASGEPLLLSRQQTSSSEKKQSIQLPNLPSESTSESYNNVPNEILEDDDPFPIAAEEEFQLSLKKALVQSNPWLPSSEKKNRDPLAAEVFTSQEIEGCSFRQFENHTIYSKPSFIQEYLKHVTCSRKSQESSIDSWLRHKISVEKGTRGDLRLSTNFNFPVNIDLARKRSRHDGLFCSPNVADQTVVLYIVFSTVAAFHRRDAIRQTWAKRLTEKHNLIFFVGKPESPETLEKLRQEQQLHNDIVGTESDEEDALFEHRQFVSALAWAYRYCEPVQFVAKLTDSTFVNVRRFALLVKQEIASANRIYGTLLRRRQPDREVDHDHYVSEKIWPWNNFPPFMKGPSYIFTGDVVPRLLVAARFTPVLPLQQVYFTGLAPLINQIMRIGVNSFFSELPFPELRELALDGDECAYARHGTVEGLATRRDMDQVATAVDYIQEDRNVTCTVKSACLAKVNGNCLFYSPNSSKKKKKDKSRPNRSQL